MIWGLDMTTTTRAPIQVKSYKYQSILDFWNGTPLNALRMIWRAVYQFASGMCSKIFIASGLVLRWVLLRHRQEHILENGSTPPSVSLGDLPTEDYGRLDSLLRIIDEESIPSFSRLWSLFHASSIPL